MDASTPSRRRIRVGNLGYFCNNGWGAAASRVTAIANLTFKAWRHGKYCSKVAGRNYEDHRSMSTQNSHQLDTWVPAVGLLTIEPGSSVRWITDSRKKNISMGTVFGSLDDLVFIRVDASLADTAGLRVPTSQS
jgi:hypothetical protein